MQRFQQSMILLGVIGILAVMLMPIVAGRLNQAPAAVSYKYAFLPCGSYDGGTSGTLDTTIINQQAKNGWELVPINDFTPSTSGRCMFRKLN